MKMTKPLAACAAAVVLLASTAGVAFAASWKIVAQKSASGDFAATATDATVNHPHHIGVRFRGSGLAVWACDKGYSVSSWSHHYGAGLHELAHVAGKDSCDVTASVGGSGRVSVQILTHR